jgi:RNA polymerase sigma-70 factor (ECF subfamily)
MRRQPIGTDLADEELVRRVRAGDGWAREALFRKHVDVMFRTSLRLLGQRADAEDVVQDSFCEAFRDIAGLREPGALRVWLLRIAVHRCHKLFRRRKLLRVLGLARGPEETLTELALPESGSETRLELLCVDRALGRVSASARMAWLLRYVEGHSLLEVAELVGCSLATVKRRITEAARAVEAELGVQAAEEAP